MISPRFRSLLLGLFYAALASLPLSVNWLSPWGHFGLMVAAEPLMVVAVGLAGLGVLAGWVARPGSLSLLDKLVGLHLGALLLATACSSDVRVSAKYVATVLVFVGFGYGVPRVLRLGRREWQRAGAALGAGTAALALFVLARHVQLGISYALSYAIAQPFLPHGHTNLTVLLEPLVLALSLGLLLLPRAQAPRGRLLATALLAAVLMVVAFSYSRASYVSLAVQAVLLLVLLGRPAVARLWLPWAVAGALVLGAWQGITWRLAPSAPAPVAVAKGPGAGPLADPDKPPTLLHELGSVSDFTPANESNAERLNRWKYGLVMYQQTPVLGIGPGTFPDRYLDFMTRTTAHDRRHPTFFYTTFRRMNVHNLYLGWLIEAGALGLLTGLLVLGYAVVRQLRRVWHGERSALDVGLALYFVFFLLHSFAQDFWQEPRVIVVFWLAVSLQCYAARAARAPAEAPLQA
ncbi:O-antigen ligase family protein [Hymenobacter nivis]|uniref:O-antigen ligase domain-containing protein n=1 Tax=Hymenobacter nivis TaxID=1850093 RepID=A0A502H167_9BACT|nr:O-antigen ligase family protein [Hymenobacter nivis]TPG67106.1 O-antigen ligase domain-containing protein [Hymenobacter nivis]